MSVVLARLYRLVRPILGPRSRRLAHTLRSKLYGDTSQLGEAVYAMGLIKRGWPTWIVEVGANDGITASNSRLFVRRGWDALLIEPNPQMFRLLASNSSAFPGVRCVQSACSNQEGSALLSLFEGDEAGMLSTLESPEKVRDEQQIVSQSVVVKRTTLTALLEEYRVPDDFSILSVDTEGHDLQVLQGTDLLRYRPRIIITETDAATEADKHSLLRGFGYGLHANIGVNTLWTLN